MDLKDFVAGSLTQIVEGIREAQKTSAASGAWINPAGELIHSGQVLTVRTREGRGYLHEVRFDVAVTVSDENKAGGGAGLQIFGAKLGAEDSVTSQNAAVSRVQFSVPVVWPGQTQPELERRLALEKERDDAAIRGDNWKTA